MRDMKDILRTDPLLWPSAKGISKNKQDEKKKERRNMHPILYEHCSAKMCNTNYKAAGT